MGLISKALGFTAFSLEDPSNPLMPTGALYESLGLGRSDAGVLVNAKQAERQPTVFTCIRNISEDLGRISLDIFQEMPDGSLRLAKEHKNYYLLHHRPNAIQSSTEWRHMMWWCVGLHGNGFSWIKRDNSARPISFVPLHPEKVQLVQGPTLDDYLYKVTQTVDQQPVYVDPSDMLHFKANAGTGFMGRSPIALLKNMVGMGLAAEKFGAQLFGNGARTTGIFTHPHHLDPEAYDNLKKALREQITGDNALRPLILEEGLTYEQLTINPQDAQLLELRKFTKEEIAQVFRMPLHLLQDLTKATNANLEFQGTEYVRHCLMWYAVQMESEINFKIIGLKTPYIVEHNFQDLTRGDLATQTAAFISLLNAGVYSDNDVLRGLRQNPIPASEGGDLRRVNGAFIPLTALLDYVSPALLAAKSTQTSPDTDTDPNGGDAVSSRRIQFTAAYRPLFRDALGRSLHRSNDPEFVKKAFQPTVISLAQALKPELSPEDIKAVTGLVNSIAVDSAGWTAAQAATIATRLTESIFAALTEVLS